MFISKSATIYDDLTSKNAIIYKNILNKNVSTSDILLATTSIL